MIFLIGRYDGDELLGLETVEGADEALQLERRCCEATDGNVHLRSIDPSMELKNGQWFARHEGVEKALQCDHRRNPSWSSDGKHWESHYHAIERSFASNKNHSID